MAGAVQSAEAAECAELTEQLRAVRKREADQLHIVGEGAKRLFGM